MRVVDVTRLYSTDREREYAFTLLWRDVLFGFFTYDRNKRNHFYVINFIILLAKFHSHKCKFTNKTPHFLTYKNKLNCILRQLITILNKKAVGIISVCMSLKVLVQCDIVPLSPIVLYILFKYACVSTCTSCIDLLLIKNT